MDYSCILFHVDLHIEMVNLFFLQRPFVCQLSEVHVNGAVLFSVFIFKRLMCVSRLTGKKSLSVFFSSGREFWQGSCI